MLQSLPLYPFLLSSSLSFSLSSLRSLVLLCENSIKLTKCVYVSDPVCISNTTLNISAITFPRIRNARCLFVLKSTDRLTRSLSHSSQFIPHMVCPVQLPTFHLNRFFYFRICLLVGFLICTCVSSKFNACTNLQSIPLKAHSVLCE